MVPIIKLAFTARVHMGRKKGRTLNEPPLDRQLSSQGSALIKRTLCFALRSHFSLQTKFGALHVQSLHLLILIQILLRRKRQIKIQS